MLKLRFSLYEVLYMIYKYQYIHCQKTNCVCALTCTNRNCHIRNERFKKEKYMPHVDLFVSFLM